METRNSTGSFREIVENYFHGNRKDGIRIDSEVSIKYETTAISRALSPSAVLFTNIAGYEKFRVVSNLFGSENRIMEFTGTRTREDFLAKWKKAMSPVQKNDLHYAPNPGFRDNVFTSDDLDVFSIPAPYHYSGDGSRLSNGRYISSALLVSRDPENHEIHNLGFTRIQLLDRKRIAFDAGSRGHTWSYLDKSIRDNESMEITFVIGVPPILYLLGASFTDNEYFRAEHFMNVDVAEGYRNHIPIPHGSEIVMEATFVPGEILNEGPFAEYTGYMGYDTTGYVADVKSLMYRDDPIYYDIVPSNSEEHLNIFSFPRSLMISSSILESLPGGTDINVEWPTYASRFLALGCVESRAGDVSLQVACGIISRDPLWAKIVFLYNRKCSLELPGFLASLASSSAGKFRNVTFMNDSFIISSDVGSDGKMRSGRMIALLEPCEYRIVKNSNSIEIVSGKHRCIISRQLEKAADLSIIVPDDIDIQDFNSIGWAIATRVNPSRDVMVKGNKMVISACHEHPETPAFPDGVAERVRELVENIH